jgi:hypothetical protein
MARHGTTTDKSSAKYWANKYLWSAWIPPFVFFFTTTNMDIAFEGTIHIFTL